MQQNIERGIMDELRGENAGRLLSENPVAVERAASELSMVMGAVARKELAIRVLRAAETA